jgi:hypothetical protein
MKTKACLAPFIEILKRVKACRDEDYYFACAEKGVPRQELLTSDARMLITYLNK